MIITKKRIRSLKANFESIDEGQEIVLCVCENNITLAQATRVGFSHSLSFGETVLPAALGGVSRFNAEGRGIPQRDQEKEICYRQAEWTWKQYSGRDDFEEMTKIVDIPYKRFPRKYIPAPSIELSVVTDAEGRKLIASEPLSYVEGNSRIIVHVVNLFLELFGSCEVRNQDLKAITKSPLISLNWEIFPQGEKPWEEVRAAIEPRLQKLTRNKRAVVQNRLETVGAHAPTFVAAGNAGFSGYLVFGFPERNLYILESAQTNNATYVLESDWKYLSSLTKAEILNADLHKERIIHRESWFREIERVLAA